MTIENTQPLELNILKADIGYTYGVIVHAPIGDEDAQAKIHWIDGVLQPKEVGIFNDYLVLSTLQPETTYQVETAIADAMVTDEMLSERNLISITDPTTLSTLKEPTIVSHSVVASHVDIGVAPANLVLNLEGAADTLQVQYSIADADNWVDVYYATFSEQVIVPNLPEGALDIRIKGRISFENSHVEESSWSQISGVVIANIYEPPTAPTGVSFSVAKLAEPSERYDVLVSWDWEQSDGANIREFILEYIPVALYASNGLGDPWAGSTLTNTGAAQSAVVTNHPFNEPMLYRVGALAWGPTEENLSFSEEVPFTLNESTPIDNDWVTQTGVEVTYAHIKGLRQNPETTGWEQTFLLDAATGAVSIGLLDETGKAPISFDPTQGNVNVDGSVIANDIIAANFIMANLDGDDSPQIRTTTKETYGDPDSGIFLGYEGGKYKFDLGDSQNYVRYDGDTLYISGNVVIGDEDNNVPIGNNSSFVATIYRNDTALPQTPAGTAYPPTGWSTAPLTPIDSEITYLSTSRVSEATGELVEGESWSVPASIAGGGSQGLSVANVVIYKRNIGPPDSPDNEESSYNFTTQELIAPTGWTTVPESSNGINGELYSATALVTALDITVPVTPIFWGPPALVAMDGEVGPAGYRDYRWGPTATVDGSWTPWVSEGGAQRETDSYAQSREMSTENGPGEPSIVYAITGQAGSGWYTIIGNDGIFPDDTTATNEFVTEFGRLPTLDDHLTYVDFAQPATTTSETKRCNSLRGQPVTWSSPTLVVNGDTLIRGTVSADRLVAKSIKGEQISSETTIIAGGSELTSDHAYIVTVAQIGSGSNVKYGMVRDGVGAIRKASIDPGDSNTTQYRGEDIVSLHSWGIIDRTEFGLWDTNGNLEPVYIYREGVEYKCEFSMTSFYFVDETSNLFTSADVGKEILIYITDVPSVSTGIEEVAGINGNDAGTVTDNPYKDIRFWAGTSTPRDATGAVIAPMHVDKFGKLTATGADITGHITAESMTFPEPSAIPPEIDNDNVALGDVVAIPNSSSYTNNSPGEAYFHGAGGNVPFNLYYDDRVKLVVQPGQVNPGLKGPWIAVARKDGAPIWAGGESVSAVIGDIETGFYLKYYDGSMKTVAIPDPESYLAFGWGLNSQTEAVSEIRVQGNALELVNSTVNYDSAKAANEYTESRIYPSQSQVQISGGGYTSGGSVGWGIHDNGYAEFLGGLNTAGATISGSTIIASDIYSGNILYHVDYDTNGSANDIRYYAYPDIPLAARSSYTASSNKTHNKPPWASSTTIIPYEFNVLAARERRGAPNSSRFRWGKVRAGAFRIETTGFTIEEFFSYGVAVHFRAYLRDPNDGSRDRQTGWVTLDYRFQAKTLSVGQLVFDITPIAPPYGGTFSGRFVMTNRTCNTFGSSNDSYNGQLVVEIYTTHSGISGNESMYTKQSLSVDNLNFPG